MHPKCKDGSSYILIYDRKQWSCTQTNTAALSRYRICQTASSTSIFLSFTIDSIDLWRCGPCRGQSWAALFLRPANRRCQRKRCAADSRTRWGEARKDGRAKANWKNTAESWKRNLRLVHVLSGMLERILPLNCWFNPHQSTRGTAAQRQN